MSAVASEPEKADRIWDEKNLSHQEMEKLST
jgi:hypothetical protein